MNKEIVAYSYNGMYSAIKKNKLLTNATTRMNLNNRM